LQPAWTQSSLSGTRRKQYLGSQRFKMRLRSLDGGKAAISISNFAGVTVMPLELGRLQKNWSIATRRDLRVNTPVLGALTNETDAIGSGFAASIAHPGGNITGFAALDSALGGKWVDLLKEIAPSTVRMAPTPSNRTLSQFRCNLFSQRLIAEQRWPDEHLNGPSKPSLYEPRLNSVRLSCALQSSWRVRAQTFSPLSYCLPKARSLGNLPSTGNTLNATRCAIRAHA
jgi:hypothetical protein